jgi:hypothetical protein
MQLKYIPLILLFSIQGFVLGQKSIPGYLGKKNCLSVNFIGGLFKRGYLSTTDGYFSKNPNLQLTYERVLNRKKTILLSVSNGGFRVDNEYLFDIFDSEAIKDKNNKSYYVYEGLIDFNVTSIQLSSQVYFRGNGAVAPLGKYFAYGLSHSFINIKESKLYYTDYNSNPILLSKITYTSTSLSTFFIGFGSKRFIDNSIFINKMIQFNLPLNFYSPPVEDYQSINPSQTLRGDLENNIVKFAFSRQNTLNFSLGVGAAF